MTSFRIERLPFLAHQLKIWAREDSRHTNWPVVYAIDGKHEIYVGESLNVAARIRQHLDDPRKRHLQAVRVVVDEKFNKSAALDLESYLIRMLAGDGQYTVLNRNDGITEADYFRRDEYQQTFEEVFGELFRQGVFTRTIPEIVNSDLFKFSPFKALNSDQAIAVEAILEGLFQDLDGGSQSTIVVQGDPGTGKNIIAIYLMKLLRDIATVEPYEDPNGDSLFADFFVEGYRELLVNLRIGLVVPQQSLRASIQKVFAKTPGLDKAMVLTPFDVGASEHMFDLLIVDETHRLNQRASQSSGSLNKKFAMINTDLFDIDDYGYTQLDWIKERSRHQLLLVDSAQGIRPADLPKPDLDGLISEAKHRKRHFPLSSQMRVQAGADYIGYVRQMLSPIPPLPMMFEGYDFKIFDDLKGMREAIFHKDAEFGLARLVAGYAWKWNSKRDPNAYDISVDGLSLRWNQSVLDWVNSPGSLNEVGSIHTVQGYDLNYAGVIIGPDLGYDPTTRKLIFHRSNYHDPKGKQDNGLRGIKYSDDDLLELVTNIYAVLLTRGILGTYVYVCDPALRDYLGKFIPAMDAS